MVLAFSIWKSIFNGRTHATTGNYMRQPHATTWGHMQLHRFEKVKGGQNSLHCHGLLHRASQWASRWGLHADGGLLNEIVTFSFEEFITFHILAWFTSTNLHSNNRKQFFQNKLKLFFKLHYKFHNHCVNSITLYSENGLVLQNIL